MIEQLGKPREPPGGGKLRGVHHGVVDSLCGQVRYQQQRCVDRLRVGVITHDEDVHEGPLSVFAMMSNHTITRKRIFMSDKLARARHTRSADLAASAASPQTLPDTHATDPASGESRPSQGGADQGSTAAIGGSAALISICTIVSRITGFARTWAMAFALGSTLLSSSYQVANNPSQPALRAGVRWHDRHRVFAGVRFGEEEAGAARR